MNIIQTAPNRALVQQKQRPSFGADFRRARIWLAVGDVMSSARESFQVCAGPGWFAPCSLILPLSPCKLAPHTFSQAKMPQAHFWFLIYTNRGYKSGAVYDFDENSSKLNESMFSKTAQDKSFPENFSRQDWFLLVSKQSKTRQDLKFSIKNIEIYLIFFGQTKTMFCLSVPFLEVQKAPHNFYIKEVINFIVIILFYFRWEGILKVEKWILKYMLKTMKFEGKQEIQ